MNAWAAGGLIPSAMRGTKLSGLAAVWDSYATFAALAGADPTDHRAAAAGLPPVDSIDLWPYLSGQVAGSRIVMFMPCEPHAICVSCEQHAPFHVLPSGGGVAATAAGDRVDDV